MNRPKIVIIGTSPIVPFHVNALRKSGLDPVAVSSSHKNSFSHKKFSIENNIPNSFSDWEKMIHKEKYDGILIASRTKSTIEILKESIKQHVPILVEKPVSFSSQDIKKLIKTAHDMIMVGYNRRFYKPVNELKYHISENNKSVFASMIAPDEVNIENFFSNTAHSIDLLRYVFGDIKIKYVNKLQSNKKIKGLVAEFSNKNNDLIQFLGNWGASDNFSLSVYSDSKKFQLKPYEELKIFDGMKITEPTKSEPIRKYVPTLKKTIKLEKIDQKIKPGFYQQSEAFLNLIKNKSITSNSASLQDAFETVKLCEKLVGNYKFF